MNNSIRQQAFQLEKNKKNAVQNHTQINNIGFSTKQQLTKILDLCGEQETLSAIIFLDNIINAQQKEVASLAMGLLPFARLETTVVYPNDYIKTAEGLVTHTITEKDFENLFKKYNQNIYINYKDIIDQLGVVEAYSYIAMSLAKKQFISQEIENNIIVQSSHVKGGNGIFTRGIVDTRSNRENFFIKVDFNEK